MAWSEQCQSSVLRVLSSASDLAEFGQYMDNTEGILQWITQQCGSGNTAALQRLVQDAQLVQLLAQAIKQGMQLMQRLPEATVWSESDPRARQAVLALCDSLWQCLMTWRALSPAADEQGTQLKIAMQIARSGLLPVLAATSAAEARLLETYRQQRQEQEQEQQQQQAAHASRSYSQVMTLGQLHSTCLFSSCLMNLWQAIIAAWLPPVLASKALLPTVQPAVRLALAVLHAMPSCLEFADSSSSSHRIITSMALAVRSVCEIADTAVQLLGEGTIPPGSSEVQLLLASPATQQLLAYNMALLAQSLHQKQHGRSSVPASASTISTSSGSSSSSTAWSSQQVEVPAHHTALLEAMGVCCMDKHMKLFYDVDDVELACLTITAAASMLNLTSSDSSTRSTPATMSSSSSSTSMQHPAAALPHTQMLLVLLELTALQPTPNVVCCTLAAMQHFVHCFDSQAPAEQRAAAAGTLVQQVVQLLTPAVWAVASGHAEKDGFVPRITVTEEIQPGGSAAARNTLDGKELLQQQALQGFVKTLAGLLRTAGSYDDLAACFSQQPSLCSITMEAALRAASVQDASRSTQSSGLRFAGALAASAHSSLLEPTAGSSQELQQQLFSLLISALKCVAGICDSPAPAGWKFGELHSLVETEGITAATGAIKSSSSSSSSSSAAGQLLPQPELAVPWLVLAARSLWVAAVVLEQQLQQLAVPGAADAAAAAAGGPAAQQAEHLTLQQQQQLQGIEEIRCQLPQYGEQVQWLGAALPTVLQAAPGGGAPGALQQLSKLQDELLHALEQTVQLCGEPASSSSSECADMTGTSSAAVLQEVLQVCGPAVVAKMQQYAAGVSAQLALPLCCNNPACTNMAAISEQQLVGGKSCICAGCQVARYCGKECQTQHWKQHKPVCRRIKAAAQTHVVQQAAVHFDAGAHKAGESLFAA